jgi:DNA-binding GntR family transcriptional regulator
MPLSQRPPERLYELVCRILRAHVDAGKLPEGLVLLEGPIADFFGTSRAPVQKALKILNSEGVVRRFEGRGYVVPNRSGRTTPVRKDIRQAGLTLPADIDDAIWSRSSWQRIHGRVEREVASAAAFGRYRIHEARLASFFHVSRTVARDVLWRLHERGLVQKSPSSRWIAGPLTAAAMKEMYEIRRLLEPAALIRAAPRLDRAAMANKRDHMMTLERDHSSLTPELLHQFDRFVHVECVLKIDNKRLASIIRQNQLPLATAQTFQQYLGLSDESATLSEHRLVLELLLKDAAEAAAAALVAHLDSARKRALARLKVLSVVPAPTAPPYLVKAR